MDIQNIINDSIPSLSLTDNVEKALDLCNEFVLSSIPVVSNQDFKGLITVDMLLDQDPDQNLEHLEQYLNTKAINGQDHFFTAISFIAEHKSTLVPILDDQKKGRV